MIGVDYIQYPRGALEVYVCTTEGMVGGGGGGRAESFALRFEVYKCLRTRFTLFDIPP